MVALPLSEKGITKVSTTLREDPTGRCLPDPRTLRYSEHHHPARLLVAGRTRLAVYVALNIEAFGFGVGKGAAIAPPTRRRATASTAGADYGNRVGIWRLFELLDELGIPAEAR
jgi:hypothetical protein